MTARQHALRRTVADDSTSSWLCACGHDFGVLSVHKARAAYHEHRADAEHEPQR